MNVEKKVVKAQNDKARHSKNREEMKNKATEYNNKPENKGVNSFCQSPYHPKDMPRGLPISNFSINNKFKILNIACNKCNEKNKKNVKAQSPEKLKVSQEKYRKKSETIERKREVDAIYREKNREVINAKAAINYHKDAEDINKNRREKYSEIKDELNKKRKEKYAENPEPQKERSKKYYELNKDNINANRRIIKKYQQGEEEEYDDIDLYQYQEYANKK